MSRRIRKLSYPRDREGPPSGSSSQPSRSSLSPHGSSPIEGSSSLPSRSPLSPYGSSPIEDIAGTSQMGPSRHRDASPDLDNACDGSGDDEIEHEMMSGSSQSEMACLRPWTPSVSHIPLPEKAIALQKKCDRNYKMKREYIKRKERAIMQRLDKAIADIMREKGNKDYEKPGRHGSEEKTKVPPKGYRAILEWKGNIPVGDWAVRFNNLIGCLIRDPCSINIAHNFDEQEFKGIKKIWDKLMDHYCLEDNPESWDYVIPRMAKLIRCWKSDLKKRYFTIISADWKRIYELDKRVPPFNWMTLIIEWEGEKKKICETASANRRSKLYDHFLGSTPYARIEHKYLSENPDALTMPPTLLARRAYTPPQGYEDVDENAKKVEKINELHAALEASQNVVLTQVMQSQGIEDTLVEPNRMTRDDWMEVIDGVYGLKPRKKGRVPLSSARVKTFTTTIKPSSPSVTSTRPCDTSYVVGKIGKYLMKNVELPLALSFLPTIKQELGGTQTTWDVVQRLIDSQPLKELLPQPIYGDIMELAFDEHSAASGGEARGGTPVGSSSTVRHSDATAIDDRDHDDRDQHE